MSDSVKKRIGGWLILAAVFLAGTSAGSLGQLLCWHLWNGLNVESHQAMRAHATGNQISLEAQDRLKREPGRAHRAIGQEFDAFPVVFDCAFFQANQNDAVGQILRADDRQNRSFVFEQIANADLDLAVGIAQRHLMARSSQFSKIHDKQSQKLFGLASVEQRLFLWRQFPRIIRQRIRSRDEFGIKQASSSHQTIPSRLITALRYRQLYTFQNQFISLMRISCLRDARERTAVSRFSSISCPRPLVLRQFEVGALGFGLGCTFRLRHCAAVVWAAGCDMQLLPSEFERWFERFPKSALIHRTEDFNRGARIIALQNRNQISDGHTAHSQFRIARTGERRFTQNPV
jgi:hypothetical protein